MSVEDFARLRRSGAVPRPARPGRGPGASCAPSRSSSSAACATRAGAAHRGRGHRPDAAGRRTHVGQQRRQAQHAQRRGLHRPARGRAPTAASASPSRSSPAGVDVDGVELELRDGEVVSAARRARRGVPATRAGHRRGRAPPGRDRASARTSGSTAPIGTILFDEKIGGTVHLALGRSYPETGGKNRSRAALGPDLRPARRAGGSAPTARSSSRTGASASSRPEPQGRRSSRASVRSTFIRKRERETARFGLRLRLGP